ncbi:MAG: hypothetical protein JWQ04_199, partial [Pedosphaera sp.]|nr:hypothetical protein [Pedosphaera sp.]
MKFIKIRPVTHGLLLACLLAAGAKAQSPASIAGDALAAMVTSGSGNFASQGYFFLLPADSGTGYQLIGVDGVISSTGNYTYSSSNAFGFINFSNGTLGSATGVINFSSPSS